MFALQFAIGLVFLIRGADALVEGAAVAAHKLRIPDLVVGLTLVAFGTSLPELVVNAKASLEGNSALAAGNVLGSNLANSLLILGCAGLAAPLPLVRSTLRIQLPLSLLALAGCAALALEPGGGLLPTRLTAGDGWLLLAAFAGFLGYTAHLALAGRAKTPGPETPAGRVWMINVPLGLVGLWLGGKWVVDGAVGTAGRLGLSEGFIGLSLVAVGTSLPELVTSVRAARQGNAAIATGNVIGSNIFNLLWVLGISAILHPVEFEPGSGLDVAANFIAGAALLAVGGRKASGVLSRPAAVVFLGAYCAYLLTTFFMHSG